MGLKTLINRILSQKKKTEEMGKKIKNMSHFCDFKGQVVVYQNIVFDGALLKQLKWYKPEHLFKATFASFPQKLNGTP